MRWFPWASAAILIILLVPTHTSAWPSPHTLGPFGYISPAPGSSLHHPETKVIVRPGGNVDLLDSQEILRIVGSLSGEHPLLDRGHGGPRDDRLSAEASLCVRRGGRLYPSVRQWLPGQRRVLVLDHGRAAAGFS